MFVRAAAVGERYGSLYQRLDRKYLLKFNDVYLLMPELMNQQTIMVHGKFISIEIMSENLFYVESSETSTEQIFPHRCVD